MSFSTNYFGNIPYFQVLSQYSVIEIDLFERYKKQSWRNRTQILESNGPLYLSIPVFRPEGNTTLVKDIQILDKENWRKDHWKGIESSYQHAPYFFYYGEQIKELIYQEEKLLVQFNTTILKKILMWLDFDIDIQFTSTYSPPNGVSDYRVSLNQKKYKQNQVKYIQVFSDKFKFYPNLSIIDLLMNIGPLAHNYVLCNRFSTSIL